MWRINFHLDQYIKLEMWLVYIINVISLTFSY